MGTFGGINVIKSNHKKQHCFLCSQSLHHNVCVCPSVHLKVHRNVLKEKYHHWTAFSEIETFFKGIITEEFVKNILLLLFCSGWKKKNCSLLLSYYSLCISHTCARATDYQVRHINRESMLNGAGAEIVVKELLIWSHFN